MNDPIARLRAAATVHQPAWNGDLDLLVRRSRARRMKAATAGATAMTVAVAVLVLPASDSPRGLGATADRGITAVPDRADPEGTAAPTPDASPHASPTATDPARPAASVLPGPPLPGGPGVPGSTALPTLPGLPTGDPTAEPTESPSHRPPPTVRPSDRPSPDPSPGPRNWWDHSDSPVPDPAPYRDVTFGPAPYYERRYVAGDADTYCTHPPPEPVLPRPGEEQPVGSNFWYGIAKDRNTWVVTTSLCIPDDRETATYQFAGHEIDLYLWAEDIGYAKEQALYTWSKHQAPEPAHSVTINAGDCVQYVWNLPLGDDAGQRLAKGRRFNVGGEMGGATAEEGRWNWYGQEFYG